MKKSLLAITFVAFSVSAKTTRLRNYGCIAVVLLAGCTATQVRWDATNIRKEVMVYYNDQIMDNLIRAKNHLPFVHVDITLLTSQGASQISGTIGAGETITNTGMQQRTNQTVKTDTTSAMPSHMLARTIATMGTLAHAAMRPFMASVTPQQTETLSIQAAPALGGQAIAYTSGPMIPTKVTTETWGQEEKVPTECTKYTTERTPTSVTIYKLYEDFAKCYVEKSPIRPSEGEYVPDTLKKWDRQYYYVPARKCCDCQKRLKEDNQTAYYKFCRDLFIKGQSQTGSLEKAIERAQAAAALR